MFDATIARSYVIHAIRRAVERYQVMLNENQLCEISNLILSGRATLKRKSYNQRNIYKVNYLGRNFVVVFDTVQLLPVTFLPHKSLRKLV